MEKEDNVIIRMLSGSDQEIVILGMSMSLGKGEPWCRENIPAFGICLPNPPEPLSKGGVFRDAFGLTDGRIAIMYNPQYGIDVRYLRDFTAASRDRFQRI